MQKVCESGRGWTFGAASDRDKEIIMQLLPPLDGKQVAVIRALQERRASTSSAYQQNLLDRAIDYALSPERAPHSAQHLRRNVWLNAREAERRHAKRQQLDSFDANSDLLRAMESSDNTATVSHVLPDAELLADDLESSIRKELSPLERACLDDMLRGGMLNESVTVLRRSARQVKRLRASVRGTAVRVVAREAA
jgi:hypothetical protein